MSIISDLVSIPVVVHSLNTNWSVLNYNKDFSCKSRFIFVIFLKTDSLGQGYPDPPKIRCTHDFAFYCRRKMIVCNSRLIRQRPEFLGLLTYIIDAERRSGFFPDLL